MSEELKKDSPVAEEPAEEEGELADLLDKDVEPEVIEKGRGEDALESEEE